MEKTPQQQFEDIINRVLQGRAAEGSGPTNGAVPGQGTAAPGVSQVQDASGADPAAQFAGNQFPAEGGITPIPGAPDFQGAETGPQANMVDDGLGGFDPNSVMQPVGAGPDIMGQAANLGGAQFMDGGGVGQQQGTDWQSLLNPMSGPGGSPNALVRAGEGYNRGGLIGALGYLLTDMSQNENRDTQPGMTQASPYDQPQQQNQYY